MFGMREMNFWKCCDPNGRRGGFRRVCEREWGSGALPDLPPIASDCLTPIAPGLVVQRLLALRTRFIHDLLNNLGKAGDAALPRQHKCLA